MRIVFVGQDGGVCPLYIEGVASVPNTDIGVGLLNAEVTPNIMPARVLPDDYAKWIGTGEGLPVLTLDQKECASLTQLNGVPTNGPARVWNRTPKSESWKRFFKRMVGGDSGNPAFALVADQPILLYCLKTGGPGSGTWIHRHKPAIQKAMDELCPGYKLEEFDFSKVVGGEDGENY